MDRSIIDQYEAGAAKLKQAIAGLSGEQLRAAPIPGKWSMQQLVLHLMDSDLVMTERMKRIIAEKRATFLAFDENRWMESLAYAHQPAEEAADLFELNRKLFARVLRELPDATFARIGVHSERGNQSLEDIVKFAVSHLEHHLKFAAEKRSRLVGTA
jgi:uncharacterized damage-inducible protein DinB